MPSVEAIEDEIERLDNVIKAAENWAKEYTKDAETHAGIIKVESKLERLLRGFFRDQADRIPSYIDWIAYNTKLREVQAASTDDFEVIVTISDDQLGYEDGILVQTIFDPITAAVVLGANYGETVYNIELGLTDTSAVIQKTAREMVAELVGKKLANDGTITDNPKAKYRISDKTRQDIRESIRTSLSLGETQDMATERLRNTIKNPKRAATIARTESVNAYQKGLLVYGDQSGAVAKEWRTVNTEDICGSYASLGIVDLNFDYNGLGLQGPAAHPNCRCALRLVYPEEYKMLKGNN